MIKKPLPVIRKLIVLTSQHAGGPGILQFSYQVFEYGSKFWFRFPGCL
jgi:hypothetical protein